MATPALSLSNSTTSPTSLFEEDNEFILNIFIFPLLDDGDNSSNSDLSSCLSSVECCKKLISGWKMSASFDSKIGRDHLSAVRGLLHVCIAISNFAHLRHYRVSLHRAG
eukprot:9198226-Ditylum_brightwellii.AAC.1